MDCNGLTNRDPDWCWKKMRVKMLRMWKEWDGAEVEFQSTTIIVPMSDILSKQGLKCFRELFETNPFFNCLKQEFISRHKMHFCNICEWNFKLQLLFGTENMVHPWSKSRDLRLTERINLDFPIRWILKRIPTVPIDTPNVTIKLWTSCGIFSSR